METKSYVSNTRRQQWTAVLRMLQLLRHNSTHWCCYDVTTPIIPTTRTMFCSQTDFSVSFFEFQRYSASNNNYLSAKLRLSHHATFLEIRVISVDENCALLCYWHLKMGSKVCPEMSARNYHFSLRNNPEERSCVLGYWPTKTETTGFPETSVRNYSY